jgi:hypothetical protein
MEPATAANLAHLGLGEDGGEVDGGTTSDGAANGSATNNSTATDAKFPP